MTQDTRVVIKHLDEDIPPEPAQPLTIPEHADSTARSLVNRLERPHLHTCNGSDRIRRGPSGNTAPPPALQSHGSFREADSGAERRI
jgi:hypothetical protein